MWLLSGVSAFPHKKVTSRLQKVAFCALRFEIRYCFHLQGRKVGLRSHVQPLFPFSHTEPLPRLAFIPNGRWRQHASPKLHGVTSHETVLSIFISESPSCVTHCADVWFDGGWGRGVRGVMAFRDCERNLITGLYLMSGRSNIIL